MPAPPPHLSEEALGEWERTAEILHRIGILTLVDMAVLAAYCQAYGRWAQAEKSLAEIREKDKQTHGLIIKTAKGNVVQNPLVGAANKAAGDMVRFAAELGMTPSARSRVKRSDGDSKDPAAKYFG